MLIILLLLSTISVWIIYFDGGKIGFTNAYITTANGTLTASNSLLVAWLK